MSVWCQVTFHYITTELSTLIRNLGITYSHIVVRNSTVGASYTHRWSTPKIAWHSLQLGLTPFHCILGYQPSLFPWLDEPPNVSALDDLYQRSREVVEGAHVQLQRAIQHKEAQANCRSCPHDSVPPTEVDGSQAYIVHAILDYCSRMDLQPAMSEGSLH